MLPDAIYCLNQILHSFYLIQQKGSVAFGCGGGKDRTGVITALLLKSLEYTDEIIIEDYVKSRDYILSKMHHFIARYKPQDVPECLYCEQMLSKTESIQLFLNHLNERSPWKKQLNTQILERIKHDL